MIQVVGNIDFISGSGLMRLFKSNNIYVSGHIIPQVNDTYNLGRDPDRFWGACFARSGIFDISSVGDLDVSTLAVTDIFAVEASASTDIGGTTLFSTARPSMLIAPATTSPAATLADLANGAASVNTLNGLSGVIALTSPDNSIVININGQNIELTAAISGLCSVHTFTTSEGTSFMVNHNLNTADFVWSLWRTEGGTDCSTLANVAPSGVNDAIIELATPINGKLVIQGCAGSGTVVGNTIATRTVSGHYTASALDGAIFADASMGALTITLPSPSGNRGKNLYVKKIDASGTLVTLNANGSGLIDEGNTVDIVAQYDALRVTAHGGSWWTL